MEGQALLNRHSDEDCSGCKVEQAKELGTDRSFQNVSLIWIIIISASLPISSLYTYFYFMVKDFHVADRDEDINTFAGYVGSAFMFGRTISAMLWGMASNRIGRKPVIVMGLFSVVLFDLSFGFSPNIKMAFIFRFCLGFLNGSSGPMRAFSKEIFREHGYGSKHVCAAAGVATVLGSSLSGYLAQSVEKYPHIFQTDSIWDMFPYLLPNLVNLAFAIVALIVAYIWLPETIHNKNCSRNSAGEVEAHEVGKLFKNWDFGSSVLVYYIFSLDDIAYQEVFSLWAVGPQRLGGLNFTTNDVGKVLAMAGIVMVIFQLAMYPLLQKRCGYVNLSRIAGVSCVLLLQCHPFITKMSGSTQFIVITFVFTLKSLISISLLAGRHSATSFSNTTFFALI